MNLLKMTDCELYEYCREIGGKARLWKKRFVATLPEIARRGIHKKKGFATITEFAAKVGGVGKKTVEAVFQVEKRIKDKPALMELLPKVGVNKVRVISSIATKENQKDLAEKVQTMSKPALELFARSQREGIKGIGQAPPGRKKREHISFGVDEKIALKLRKFKQRIEKERRQAVDWNEVMKALLENVEDDQERCAFPDCNKPAEEIHHPERYSLTKSHENVKPLCKTHHEIAHHGLIENEEGDPTTWRIRKHADRNHPKFWIDRKTIKHKQFSF
ncbi:hypothetical protein ACFL3C_02070 [Patescibacteria group bacterium]